MSIQPATGGDSADCTASSQADADGGLANSHAALDRALKSIIADVLGIDANQANELSLESGLFGHLPELDSMAVAGLLTEMEDRLDIVIEDDDVDGEMLETYGGLLAFAESKLSET
ncbi:phosphopantetheine-binding protein [Qipengyuania sp. ASV99]|uniref:phosphopantetheine-binding protein n=1 Tax=Qipengyuania sp. ASV99 TaxID=3399681 RepID=UPI003A4C7216